MPKEMLIEHLFPQESRVAITQDGKLVDFDVSTENRKQLRNNIYLGTVVRVEPSLQAVFVDYGKGRNGFLPFNSIHINYYDIPKQDLEKLLEEAKDLQKQEEEKKIKERLNSFKFQKYLNERSQLIKKHNNNLVASEFMDLFKEDKKFNKLYKDFLKKQNEEEKTDIVDKVLSIFKKARSKKTNIDKDFFHYMTRLLQEQIINKNTDYPFEELLQKSKMGINIHNHAAGLLKDLKLLKEKEPELLSSYFDDQEESLELVGKINPISSKEKISKQESQIIKAFKEREAQKPSDKEDSYEDYPDGDDAKTDVGNMYRNHFTKKYSIQEVIKRGQLMVVQVTREERGNKGTTLTTYISLAGRYCVLMPNSYKRDGISKKIRDPKLRQKLRKIIDSFNLPNDMSLIMRTAGEKQLEQIIRRDLKYLLKLWNKIVNTTMQSHAPSLIHEESDQISRCIRDMYDNDISKILIQGKAAYEKANDFCQLMLPALKKKISEYKEPYPLLDKFEDQIEELCKHVVSLPSGGYIVISPTEALTAIDVNSGQANQNHSIEVTAYKTNLEAVEEISRQIRLRNTGGLIVLDLIDMEDRDHIHAVENAMRGHLSKDSARTNMLPISSLGLMEMTRQRTNSNVHEVLFDTCGACNGSSLVMSEHHKVISVFRKMLSMIHHSKEKITGFKIFAEPAITTNMLNYHKDKIAEIEEEHKLFIVTHAQSNTEAKIVPEYEKSKPESSAEAKKVSDSSKIEKGNKNSKPDKKVEKAKTSDKDSKANRAAKSDKDAKAEKNTKATKTKDAENKDDKKPKKKSSKIAKGKTDQ